MPSQIWKTGSVTEALDVEWLRNYLRTEAGMLYGSYNPEDAVWSIYTFFCWHTNSEFELAHRDLCNLAEISEHESLLYDLVKMGDRGRLNEIAPADNSEGVRRWSAPEEGCRSGRSSMPARDTDGGTITVLHIALPANCKNGQALGWAGL